MTALATQRVELPAHLRAIYADVGANITKGTSVPTLGFKNKIWSVRDGDEIKPLMAEIGGETMASPFADVVIVGKNPNRSRMFYQESYEPDSSEPPTCASLDGIRPDAGVASPQSSTCAACPQNVKGSKMAQNGTTPIRACGVIQRIAVVPAKDLASKPLQLSFRGLSLYDPDNKPNEIKGYYCYSGYENSLTRDGINNTGMVVTRIGFDLRPEVAGVKLLFKRMDGWLDEVQARAAVAHMKSDAVAELIGAKPRGNAPALAAPVAALPVNNVVAIAAPVVAPEPPAPVIAEAVAEVVKAPKPKAVPKPKVEAVATSVDEDPEMLAAIESARMAMIARRAVAEHNAAREATKAAKVAVAKPTMIDEVAEVTEDDEISQLLGEWANV